MDIILTAASKLLLTMALVFSLAALGLAAWMLLRLQAEIRELRKQWKEQLERLVAVLEAQSQVQPAVSPNKGIVTKTAIVSGQTGTLNRLDDVVNLSREMNQNVVQLREAIEAFSPAIVYAPDSIGENLDQVFVEVRVAMQAYADEMKNVSVTIVQEQQAFRANLADLFEHFQAQITDALRRALPAPPPTEALTQLEPGQRKPYGSTVERSVTLPVTRDTALLTSEKRTVTGDRRSESGMEDKRASGRSAESPPPNKYIASEDLQLFNDVRDWVRLNLLRIMRRSEAEWNRAEALLLDNPAELDMTAQVLDGKVLLVGTKDCNRQVALGLPKRKLGATFDDWFIMPEGPDAAVVLTDDPAVVQRSGDTYQVIYRGSLKQVPREARR